MPRLLWEFDGETRRVTPSTSLPELQLFTYTYSHLQLSKFWGDLVGCWKLQDQTIWTSAH